MKRTLVILSILTGVVLLGYGALYLAYGDFARGVVEDANRMENRRPIGATINLDTCYYSLRIPPDLDFPETPSFDTTIVRRTGCTIHWLQFPAQGTSTTYRMQRDTIVREVGFYMHDESEAEWLDISTLPVGEYQITLLACGNGGSFALSIE